MELVGRLVAQGLGMVVAASLALGLLMPRARAQSCGGGIAAPRSYVCGDKPQRIVHGDLDADGILDVAVTNLYAYGTEPSISVWLGNGDGTFRKGTDVTGLSYAGALVAADFNRDGAVDFAVGQSYGTQNVVILLGTGAGAFTSAGSYDAGATPSGIASGDLDGDGDFDLVTANGSADTVTILLGNGAGGFAVGGSPLAGNGPFAAAIADLDSDAVADVLTGNADGTLSYLQGLGNGTFQAPIVFSSGASAASAMAVGRMDSDAIPDVVLGTGSYSASSVRVLIATGTGSFQQPRTTAVGDTTVSLALADLDVDGRMDVLLGGAGTVGTLLGDGTGGLSAMKTFVGGGDDVTGADFDRDGLPDVVAISLWDTAVSFRGLGGGFLVAASSYEVANINEAIRVIASDLDGDGDRDLVVVDEYRRHAVLTNDGSGTFQAGTASTGTSYGAIDAVGGDLNGDGRFDLIVSASYEDVVVVYLGAPGGTFLGPSTFPTASGPMELSTGDFNRDGRLDVVALTDAGSASVLLGNGNGTLQSAINTFVGNSGLAILAQDLDGDQLADLLVCRRSSDDIAVLIGNGDGTFQAAMLVPVGPSSEPSVLAAGDFNGDGIADVAASAGYYSGSPGTVYVLIGNGNGTFQPSAAYAVDAVATSVVPADFDGNGTTDLFVGILEHAEVSILPGAGNGTFTALASYAIGSAHGLAVADLNGDGAPDLASATGYYPTKVYVALSQGPLLSPGSLPAGFVGGPYSQALTLLYGTPPITFSLIGGALPAGLALSPSGVISGVPTAAGTSSFTVQAVDGRGCRAQRSYAIVVDGKVAYLVGQGLGLPNPNRVRLLGKSGGGSAVDFLAYGAGQWGVNVAAGNVDTFFYDGILTGPGPGAVYGPQVRAFSRFGTAIAKVNFYAYGTLRYGVNVGSANVDLDGYGEILSGAGPGAVFGPHVRGFDYDGASVAALPKVSYFAYGTLKYGVNVAGGDVDADGFGEIVTGAGPGAVFDAHVRGWNVDGGAATSMSKISFVAFSYAGFGANVAAGSVDADAFEELSVSPGPRPVHPCRFAGFDYDASSVSPLAGFDATRAGSLYGGRVALGDVSGDGRADLLTGLGRDPAAPASVLSYTYSGTALSVYGASFAAFPGTYGVNVAWGTFD